MWFLLLKIFFLLCLAALSGAALAWWWLHRRMVDVTESHSELTRQVTAFSNLGPTLTRDDVEASLQRTLSTHLPPPSDILPLQERLSSIEAHLMAPNQDIDALHDRVGGLEHSISAISSAFASLRTTYLDSINQRLQIVASRVENFEAPDLEPVATRLRAIETSVTENRAPDLRPVEARLERLERALETLDFPETDLGPIHSALARIDLTLSDLAFPETDLEPVQSRLAQIEQRLASLPARSDVETLAATITAAGTPDFDPVNRRLAAIEDAIGQFDLSIADLMPVAGHLNRIESQLSAPAPVSDELIAMLAGLEGDLDVLARRRTDFEPIYSQLSALDAALAGLRTDLRNTTRTDGLERRITSLQDTILNQPQPNFEEISYSLRALAGRMDLEALENRLTAIEYSLTAVHNMLRSRGELVEPRLRPAPLAPVETRAMPARPPRDATPPPPRRVQRAADPIALARRPDDQANLLTSAAFGTADDLEQINGIGPMLNELLNGIGVFYFWQIAEWSSENVAYVDELLQHFKGRIERDDWVGQAGELARAPGAARRPSGA